VATFPIGNIYAPPWMCVSPMIAGYDDIEFDIDLSGGQLGVNNPPVVNVPANTVQLGTATNGQQLQLDSDYDFLVREFQFVVFPPTDAVVQPSDLRVRIRDGFGRLVTSDFVQVQNLNGQLPIVWANKKGGVITFDFQNVSGSTIAVQPVLKGWKRMPCPGKPAIPTAYVPMYKRYAYPLGQGVKLEDFEYYFTFTQAAAGDLLKIPLQTDNDADFLWRAEQGDFNTANNDVAVVGNVGIRFYDSNGVALSIAGLTCPWGSQNVGQFRESILSSGGGRPAPIYPEILVPRGGVIEVDLSFGAAATCRFSLRGVKVYREGCSQ
jgi:hypothetical protein